MRKLLWALLAVAFASLGAISEQASAQGVSPTPPGYSYLGGQVPLAVTTSSANVALPSSVVAFGAVTIYNKGTIDAYIAVGGSTVAASASGTCVPPFGSGSGCQIAAGTHMTFALNGATYVAGITASSSSNLVIYQGNGPLQFGQVGGSGGGGGSGTVLSVGNTDGSLTSTPNPITNSGSLAINTAHGNVWSVGQTFDATTTFSDGTTWGSDGPSIFNAQFVPYPNASSSVNVTNINAAVTAGGTGGRIEFPANQTYVVGGCGVGIPGFVNFYPAMVNLNGSTLISTPNIAASTTASGSSGIVHQGDTTITLTSGGHTQFCVSDAVVVRDALYSNINFTYPALIVACGTSTPGAACTSDTLTTNSVRFAVGGPTAAGSAVIQRVDLPWWTEGPGTNNLNVRFTNGIIDGNLANRGTQSINWAYGDCLQLPALGHVVVDHMVIQNCPTNGLGLDDDSYAYVGANHFENIQGNGVWPGGSAIMVDYIVAHNTFHNVYQLTNATTPTVDQYDHTASMGMISDSDGATRTIVADNVLDTSTGYGVSEIDNVSGPDYNFVVAGNLMTGLTMGCWYANTGAKSVIASNYCGFSGHDTAYSTSSAHEVTKVENSSDAGCAQVAITGNYFDQSVLDVTDDACGATITGNYWDTTTLQNVNHNTNTNIIASLSVQFSTTNPGYLTIDGNTFLNPTGNVTNSLDGVRFNHAQHVTFDGNQVIGGWLGLSMTGTAYDFTINNNLFLDQSNNNSSFQNTVAVYLEPATSMTDVMVSNNNIINDVSGTNHWDGIGLATGTTLTNVLLSNNLIHQSVATASGVATGIDCSSNTGAGGLVIKGNLVTMSSTSPGSINCPSLGTTAIVQDNVVLPHSVTYNQGSALGTQLHALLSGTLSGGTSSVSNLPFTLSTSYACTPHDTTTPGTAIFYTPSSGTTGSVTGTSTDGWIMTCDGR